MAFEPVHDRTNTTNEENNAGEEPENTAAATRVGTVAFVCHQHKLNISHPPPPSGVRPFAYLPLSQSMIHHASALSSATI